MSTSYVMGLLRRIPNFFGEGHMEKRQEPPVEVRPDSSGAIDEIVAHNCNFHIEQMTADSWYVGVEASDGSYWQFWIGARNRKSAVDVRHTETTAAHGQ